MLRMGSSRTGRAVAVALLAAVMLAGCGRAARPPARSEARVPVTPARSGAVRPSATLGGMVVPYQNVAVQNSLAEPVNAVYVRAGDRVTRGQVLAVLDTRDLQAQLKQYISMAASNHAKAQSTTMQAGLTIATSSNSINAAKATLDAAQSTLAKDSLDLQRFTDLLRQGYISQQQFDQQRTLVNNDQQAVRSAQVALQNQQSQVQANGSTNSGLQGALIASARADEQTALAQADQIRAQIAKATIVSPIDGVVVNRNLNPGEYPGTRQIFTLQQLDPVYAVLNGSGGQIVGLRTGSTAQIVATDRATIKARGRVEAVLDEVTPGSTNFTVKVVLANPRGRFHAGQVVTGTVTRPATRGIVVPETAFVDDTDTGVQIVESGAVRTVPVTMVAKDGKNAVVEGLPTGAQVVVNGQLGLAEGQKVEAVSGGARRKVAAGGGNESQGQGG
jgi:multidrug efflux pump subunit AcrA (membrane-fusion protein)